MTQANYPGQPQPGYGQPYGQPYGGPAAGGASFGVVGAVIAVLGAIAGIISFTAVDWSKNDKTSFSNVHDAIANAPDSAGVTAIADAYFGWLAWTLLIVGVVVAIAANLPSPASAALRALGALVGVAGIVLSFLAIKLTDDAGYSDALKSMRVGFYLALAAFLLVAIGAAIGPRRRV